MSYARHNGKLLSPLNQGDLMKYDKEVDVLWLVNGGSISKKKILFPGCEIYFDNNNKFVTGIMIKGARELLSPILSEDEDPEGVYIEKTSDFSGLEKEIIYVKESDTLSLSNGTRGAGGNDLFMGCIVFTDMSNSVASIMLDDAGHLLLPLFER